MTGFKIAMFVGIIGGAVGLGRLLDTYTAQKLMTIVMIAAIMVFVLSLIATIRQEPRSPDQSSAVDRAREEPFWQTIRKVVLGDPQVQRFFFFMTLIMVGTQAQDIILEPFGALVLGMDVGETAMLTAIWGVGTVLAMVIAGMWLIKKAGYRPIVRLGLWLNAAVFVGLIVSGLLHHILLFKGLVFILGIGTGLASAGSLSAVVHFATPVRAGLLMSVWGLTHNLGQSIGSLLSGSLVDLLTRLTAGNALTAYGAVFAIEGLMLLVGLWLFGRVDVSESVAVAEAEVSPGP
jgi:BCD family chlorophyll transporter-like MFS transporter